MTYFKISKLKSIVRQIRLIIGRENLDWLCRPIIPQYLNIILADLKGCRNIYKCFNACANDKFKHECKWENVLNLNVDRKWWQIHYNIPFTVTINTNTSMATIRNNSQNKSNKVISIPDKICRIRCMYFLSIWKRNNYPSFFGTAYISFPCGVNLLHGIMIYCVRHSWCSVMEIKCFCYFKYADYIDEKLHLQTTCQ